MEPSSAEAACARLRDAAASGATVLPAGGGCFVDLPGPPGPVDILLRMGGICRPVFYEPEELVVKVEGGMTLAALARLLAEKGQEVPWDFPWPERQTVGGILASGLAGPRRLGAGAPRNHVLGMTVALADGRVLRTGGRVVKNAAGYDLTRLMVGSHGTLGVILEAALRVRPKPEDSWALTAKFKEPGLALGAALVVEAAGCEPAFLEVRGRRGEWTLSAGVEGLREAVTAQRERILAMLGEKVNVGPEFRGNEVAGHLAELAMGPWAEPGPVYRVGVPRTKLLEALAEARERVFASAGNGLARFAPGQEVNGSAARERLGELAALARKLGGYAVPERCPFGGDEALDPVVGELNRGARKVFDPAGILSKGRGLGG